MTTNQNALLAVACSYLLTVSALIEDHTSIGNYIVCLVVIPALVYALARIIQVLFRMRMIVTPHDLSVPRCRICEQEHRSYTLERVAAVVTERWNVSHEHRIEVKESNSIVCDKGHFIEFRKSSETKNSRKRRQAARSLAPYLRALRKGFHDMHNPDDVDSDV